MNEQAQHPQTPPPNYLVFAILTTIFCCQLFGIISIIYAAQVNSKWVSGDIEGALRASKNAKIWSWINFGFGLATILFFALIAIIVAIANVV